MRLTERLGDVDNKARDPLEDKRFGQIEQDQEAELPPQLALLIFIGFAAFVVWLDKLQFPEATRALWVPTVWLFTVSMKSLSTWFGSPGYGIEEGSALDRNFLIILICVAIGVLFRRRFSLASALREKPWLAVLFVFMLISISWSEVPFMSLKRWVREASTILMGCVVLTEKDPWGAIGSAVRRTVYLLVPLSLLLVRYFPEYGIDYVSWSGAKMWIGVADQKNGLGQLTSIAILFLIWNQQKRWRLPGGRKNRLITIADLSILGAALYLSKGSEAGFSATGYVMLAIALIGYIGLLLLKKMGTILNRNVLTLIIAFLIVFGVSTPLIGRLPGFDITSSLGRDSTLTQRTGNWALLVPVAWTKPLLGHGIGGFWTTARMDRFYYPAHNGYLEVILIQGFVGMFLMSMFLISSARQAQSQLTQEYHWGVLWICWLLMALLNSITESYLHSFTNLIMAIPLWMMLAHRSGEPKPEP